MEMITNAQLVLSFEGKELNIPVELTEAQLRRIFTVAQSDAKMSGWERPEIGDHFFYEDGLNRVQSGIVNENSMAQVEMLYEASNCYSSEIIAQSISRGDSLIRKLRRFAAESRTNSVAFYENGGYTITYNYQDKCLEIGATGQWMALGDVIFETEALAREAINKNADELVWYFTEMKDRL